MIRSCGRNFIKLSILPSLNFLNPDKVENKTPTEQKAVLISTSDSGWDRVKNIFFADEFNELSPEASSILNVSFLSCLVGAIYGGIIHSKVAYTDFMKNNQASSFRTHLDAKSKLQDAVTISFGKGAFKWGWRLSLFCTSFVCISTCVSAYRNKNGIVEYALGGAAAGAMYKFNMGPRGWIVGGGLGSVLGLVCGATTYTILSMSGMTMDEVRYWQNLIGTKRKEEHYQNIREEVEKEELAILKEHDKLVGDAGKTLANL